MRMSTIQEYFDITLFLWETSRYWRAQNFYNPRQVMYVRDFPGILRHEYHEWNQSARDISRSVDMSRKLLGSNSYNSWSRNYHVYGHAIYKCILLLVLQATPKGTTGYLWSILLHSYKRLKIDCNSTLNKSRIPTLILRLIFTNF